MDDNHKAAEDPDRISHLIHAYLQQVWTTYYSWERTATGERLKSLAKSQENMLRSRTYNESSEDSVDSNDSQNLSAIGTIVTSEDIFVVHQFEEGRPPISLNEIIPEIEIILDDFTPCMPYESCAPMSQNMFIGDDSANMPFVPLADDPEFGQYAHLLEYTSFAWQNQNDPDCEYMHIRYEMTLNLTSVCSDCNNYGSCSSCPL